VRLRVTPHVASGNLVRRGLRPKVLARTCQDVSALAAASGISAACVAAQASALAPAIEAVFTELAKTAPLTGARLEVEWADALMVFDVVAGDFAANTDSQLQAVATACMTELLGDAAQAHEVRWQLQRDGKHLLIGAVAREYLRLLSETAARHGLRLSSVEPDFCLQWNRHAAAVKSGNSVFAVLSGQDAVIACVSKGAVAAVSSGAWISGVQPNGNAIGDASELTRGLANGRPGEEPLLDIRLTRLLASVGLDPAAQSSCVLVAPASARAKVSSRWTVLNREAPTP
jgi:hypothetical protein